MIYLETVAAIKTTNKDRLRKKVMSVKILNVRESVAYGKFWKRREIAPVPNFKYQHCKLFRQTFAEFYEWKTQGR